MVRSGGRCHLPGVPTRTSVTRWLIRFAYDGRGFYGWASQPGRRTVEGEILRGLETQGLGSEDRPASLEVASRTDRGVSARGNALLLRSALPGAPLLRALNGISPEIFFVRAAPVSDTFRVRSTSGRVYRYFDPRPVPLRARREAAMEVLRGAIDARSFGRGLPSNEPCWRTVDSLSSRPTRGGTVVEVRAPSFVWGMVRKMVAALRQVDEGALSIEQLRAAAQGRVRLTLPLAEPEPLVLWDVAFPIRWEFAWRGPNRHQTRHWAGERTALWARRRVLDAVLTTSRGVRAPAAE